MPEILALLQNIAPLLAPTTVRQLSQVLFGMLVISGRLTMLGLSRWTAKGGSYRTIQRLYHSRLPWKALHWSFFRQRFLKSKDEYIIAGDEVVVSKAGRKTHGLDRFFSGVQHQVIPSLSFFTFALVNVREEQSYPMQTAQTVKSAEEKALSKAKAVTKKVKPIGEKNKPGRPKGSRNKAKQEVVLNPELVRIQTALQALLATVGATLPLKYVAMDGHFGNYPSAVMVRQAKLHLISKLRSDAALYPAFVGEYRGRGPKPKYGPKLDVRNLDAKYLKHTSIDDHVRTDLYQGQFYNKEFAFPLTVVIMLKTNLQTHAHAHVILFSTDLEQAYDQIVKFYSLRFQIEFNFRDAKQYWGLEDFMNVKEIAVTNAANLSLFMVNFSQALLHPFRQQNPDYSILDLKSHYRGYRYAAETIKLLPEKPDAILLADIFQHLARLGAIHPLIQPSASP
jgi:putative transposase